MSSVVLACCAIYASHDAAGIVRRSGLSYLHTCYDCDRRSRAKVIQQMKLGLDDAQFGAGACGVLCW